MGMEGFRARYHILQGVALQYCALDQIVTNREEGEVFIPIIAFIEGGMRNDNPYGQGDPRLSDQP